MKSERLGYDVQEHQSVPWHYYLVLLAQQQQAV